MNILKRKEQLQFLPCGLILYKNDQILFANAMAKRLYECEDEAELYAYLQDFSNEAISNKCILTCAGHWQWLHFWHLESKIGHFVFLWKDVSMTLHPLTGLPGREGFLEKAQEIVSPWESDIENCPYDMVFINVKNFKLYNIRYGKKWGDQLLQKIAQTIISCFPEELVAYLNDDHFGILAKDKLVKKQIDCLYQKIGQNLVQIHAGIFPFSKELDVAKGLECAHIACDSIYHDVASYVCTFSPAMAYGAEIKEYVIGHIDQAVKNHWIQLYEEPLVNLETKEVECVELLARWQDPKYGLLQPGIFIHALEDTYQIHKLDRYMIERACQYLADQRETKGQIIPVNINVSRMDFFMMDVFHELERNVKFYNINRNDIHIEVTESLFVNEKSRMMAEIGRFRAVGYQVWLDDFGSGYSTLNMLKEYYFDAIKMDMEFLSTFNVRSKIILSSTLKLCKDLRVKTVVEGVEKQEHVDFLEQESCDLVQGRYFGNPQPVQIRESE